MEEELSRKKKERECDDEKEEKEMRWLVQDVLRLGAEVVPDWTPLSLRSA